jgi:diguanylate cyclase (GGDEF)-like protein
VPVLLLLAAAPTAWLGLLAWRRRRAPGALPLALTAALVTTWCVLAAVDSTSSNPAVKLFLANLEYVSQSLLPVLWLLVVLEFTGSRPWQPRVQAWLFVIPAVTIALAFTTPFVTASLPLEAGAPLNYGPWFWVQSVYSILLLAASLMWLARAWLAAAPLQRGQLAMLLACMFLPLAWISISELQQATATPVVLALCTLVLVWGLFSFRLFDLAPLAQAAIVDGLAEAVVVIDLDRRIADFNPAAAGLFGWTHPDRRPGRGERGQLAAEALAAWPELAERIGGAEKAAGAAAPPTELARGLGADRRVFELALALLADTHGRPLGQLLTLRDATEHRRIEDELARRTSTDELTGLADRARAFEALSDEITRTRRYESTLALLMLDLDHFKALNQEIGRAAGDEVLRAVARAIQRLARQSDLPARPGSDEFILVLTHTNLLGAETVAGRLLAAVSQIRVGAASAEPGGEGDQPEPAATLVLSVSIGAAELAPDDDEQGEALLARAEKAMRAAQAAGGGRVMMEDAPLVIEGGV